MLRSINILHIITQIKGVFRKQKTYRDREVMLLFREPGVTGEYRPSGMSFRYYMLSVFQLNNETVNVWTHLIPAVFFLYKTYFYLDLLEWTNEAVSFFAFGLCCFGYAMMSVIAHAFHSKSPSWHYWCFQLDYAGIGAYGLGMSILFFHTGCPEDLYVAIRSYYQFIQLLPCWNFVICASIAKLKYRRPYPIQRKFWQVGAGSLMGACAGLPYILRLWNCWWDTDCEMTNLAHHTSWLWIVGVSVFFFSSHFPETLFPGKFNIIGQGHQLFHILIPILSLRQLESAYIDVIEYDINNARDVSIVSTASCVLMYIIGVCIIIKKLKPHVIARIQEDLKHEQ